MFHDIAPTYDRLNHLLSLNIDKRWRRFTAEQVMTQDTRTVLDVCSGTGDLALAFAARADELGTTPRIISTDFTRRMCELAKPKFDAASLAIPALVGDTTRLPFGDNRFDLVSVAFGIRNVADLHGGLREMVRVCRPGGQLVVLEFSHPSTPGLRQLYQLYFLRILPAVGRLLTGTRAYTYLPNSVAAFPDTPQCAQLLKEIAGGPVQAHRLSCGIATLYIATVNKPSSL
jgi:demethylmenaquinone methyltransferase/2-methoxy-6-polyprenyl-1,4-benzoquinol methylase